MAQEGRHENTDRPIRGSVTAVPGIAAGGDLPVRIDREPGHRAGDVDERGDVKGNVHECQRSTATPTTSGPTRPPRFPNVFMKPVTTPA